MRVIKQDIAKTIEQVRDMQGVTVKFKVNRGRNKMRKSKAW